MKLSTLIILFIAIAFAITSCEKDIILNEVPVADAGLSRTVQLPKDTIMLHGIGTDADGAIVGYLWSMVAGPNTPLIHKNGSDNAIVQGIIAGTYLFQFMTIDEKGATGIDTVNITVLASQPVSLTLQPAQNPDELYIAGNNINYEGSLQNDEIGVISWTDNGVWYGIMECVPLLNLI